jgi:hypothetical protein
MLKGLIAGSVNVALAMLAGAAFPNAIIMTGPEVVGSRGGRQPRDVHLGAATWGVLEPALTTPSRHSLARFWR